MKKTILIIAIILVIVLIGIVSFGYYKAFFEKVQNPIATIEVEDYGTIKVELYPKMAPNTVANFIKLANNEFYDNLTFHRIIKDFMIQGGDPLGDGTGSPVLSDIKEDVEEDSEADVAYTIEGEFAYNGHKENTLKFEEGVFAMARTSYTSLSPDLAEESYNSAGCQFFITTNDATNLNGIYCGFGKVIEGMDVVKNIAEAEIKTAEEDTEEDSEETVTTQEQSTPVNPPVIKSIRVETFGIDYGEPETLEPFNYTQWLMNYYQGSGDILIP